MKRAKQILIIALALATLLMLSLCACAKQPAPSPTVEPTLESTPAPGNGWKAYNVLLEHFDKDADGKRILPENYGGVGGSNNELTLVIYYVEPDEWLDEVLKDIADHGYAVLVEPCEFGEKAIEDAATEIRRGDGRPYVQAFRYSPMDNAYLFTCHPDDIPLLKEVIEAYCTPEMAAHFLFEEGVAGLC